MAGRRVLVVEDEKAIRKGLVDALRFAGYEVAEAADGEAGLREALAPGVDVVLLDLMLPRRDGWEVLKEARKSRPTLPIVILTAKGAEEERVRGLKSGADDYVVKPFSVKELLARIEAVLRRSAGRSEGRPRLSVAGRRLDFERREILFDDGGKEAMSEREANILAYLASCKDRAVSREELLQYVWGLDAHGIETRTVDMHVARLRAKLKDDPEEPKIIQTVRGKGYQLGD